MYISEKTNERARGKRKEDTQIVQFYWDRDERAIPATADKYGNYCTSIAKNILGNPEDAEECVNDTYMRAWNSMPPHRPNVLSIFLGKITRNVSLNRYKQNPADKRGGGEVPAVLEEIAELVSDTDSVSNLASRFGMTENHVSVTLNRLRRKLHNDLLEREFDL